MSLANAGDIQIKTVRLDNAYGKYVDLTKTFVVINIYEELMCPFMSGRIILSDSLSMNSVLPLVGEETLYIEFETPSHEGTAFKFSKRFYIYKMENNVNINPKNALLELMFVSIDGFVDMNTQISQTFRGSISSTVETILKERFALNSTSKLNIERTANNHIHTSNFWTPSQNIYYLTREAINIDGNPNFVFYENRDGLNFVSLDTLFNQAPTMEFIRDQKNRTLQPDGKMLADPSGDYARIVDMSSDNFYDYIDRLQSGMYGSAMYQYDVETRKLRYVIKSSIIDYKSAKLNANSSMVSTAVSRPTAKMILDILHKDLYPASTQPPIDVHMKRMSLLKQFSAFKTNIRVFGRAAYKVGDKYSLKIYANKNADASTPDTDLLDKMLSGNYIATSLVHDISPNNHYCNIELSKDSFDK